MRPSRSAAGSWCIALVLVCASCRPQEIAERQRVVVARLISPGVEATADHPTHPRTALYQVLQRGRVYYTAATLPTSETSIAWRVEVPAEAHLRFGYTVESPREGVGGALLYRVTARRPDGSLVDVYRAVEDVAELSGRAREIELGLQGISGKVELLFTTTETSTPKRAAGAVVHWLDPILLAPRPWPRYNVIVVCIDTLRADRLTALGGPTAVMPHLDGRLRQASVFEHAYANASWTLPSIATVMTGLYPGLHSAGRRTLLGPAPLESDYGAEPVAGGFKLVIGGRAYRFQMLHPSFPTLASLLAAQGYYTAALHDNGYLNQPSRALRGYEFVRYFGAVDAAPDVDMAIRWLRESRHLRFFLFLHLLDPHQWPLRFDATLLSRSPDALSPDERRQVLAAYDRLCAYTDEHLERFFRALAELRLDDETLVLLFADHGERFLAGGVVGSHGGSQHPDVLHVPLALWGPEIEPRRIGTRVSLVDVAPTLLDLLGVPAADLTFSGRTLAPLLRGDEEADRSFFSDFVLWPEPGNEEVALYSGRWRYAHYPARPERDGLYDLESGSDDNLIARHPARAKQMRVALHRHVRASWRRFSSLSYGETQLDEETIRSLRALGYIQ